MIDFLYSTPKGSRIILLTILWIFIPLSIVFMWWMLYEVREASPDNLDYSVISFFSLLQSITGIALSWMIVVITRVKQEDTS